MKPAPLYPLFCTIAVIFLFFAGCKKHKGDPDFSYSGTLRAGYLVSFQSNVQTALWSFGDGSQSTDPNPNHTYQAAATYTVTLVPDNDITKTITKAIVIESEYDFSYSGTPAAGYTLSFSTNAPSSGNTFLWNFGDGSTSTEAAPAHIFTENKGYDVSLTLNNDPDHTIKKTVNVFASGIHLAELPGTRNWHHNYTDAYPSPPYHTVYPKPDLELTINSISPSTITIGSDTLSYYYTSADTMIVFNNYNMYSNINNILYFKYKSYKIDYIKYHHISAGAGDANDHYFTP